MIVSAKRSAAARANGARSRGPKTPEGKARSCRNALRHGLRSQIVCLPNEDQNAFHHTLGVYARRFRPRDHAEQAIVREMAAAGWRYRRALALEQEMLNAEMDTISHATSSDDLLATAFSNLVDSGRLQPVHRYQAHNSGLLSRLLRRIIAHRRSVADNLKLPNEPKLPYPINETPQSGNPSQPSTPVPALLLANAPYPFHRSYKRVTKTEAPNRIRHSGVYERRAHPRQSHVRAPHAPGLFCSQGGK
jgi:hypothetical protein